MTFECNPSDEKRLIMALADLVSDEDVVFLVAVDCLTVLMSSDGNGGGVIVILFISHGRWNFEFTIEMSFF